MSASDGSAEAASVRDLTRRLVARAASQSDAKASSAHAVLVASELASRDLARSIGPLGFNALFKRALAQSEAAHPFLAEIRLRRDPEPVLGGVPDLIDAHGAPAVAAGLHATLETLLGLLARLIGVDVVVQLLESRAQAETMNAEERT